MKKEEEAPHVKIRGDGVVRELMEELFLTSLKIAEKSPKLSWRE